MKKINLYILSFLFVLLTLAGCAKISGGAADSGAFLNLPSSLSSVVSSEAASSAASQIASSAPDSQVVTSSQTSQIKTSIPTPAEIPKVTAPTITLVIDSSKAVGGRKLSYNTIAFQNNDTVYSVLKRVCDQIDLSISGDSSYIEAIDGIAQFVNGAQSGWIFSVNGDFPGKACGKYTLSSDTSYSILWVYTLDSGKTEEKK